MTITRIQGPKRGIAGNSSSLTVTLDNTPTSGNVLIAVVGTYGSYAPSVSSITQQSGSVSWAVQEVSCQDSLYGRRVEIWAGVVSGTVSPTLTITLASRGSGANSDPVITDVCEYSGLNTNSLKDVSGTASGTYTTTLWTGQATTSQANELWIGGIFNVCNDGNGDIDKPLTDGYILLDGVGAIYCQTKSLAYIERIVTFTGTASCYITGGSFNTYEAYVSCIVAFKGSTAGGSSGTIYVGYNEHYGGEGSKLTTVTYSGGTEIIHVNSNESDVNSNAVIENLIIDGSDVANTIGIQLQNVSNCIVRNVTIMNCDVGIRVWISDASSANGNRFEHIRMINVKQGIIFAGNSGGYDKFYHTVIDDVGISIKQDHSNGIGILVGDSNARLYDSFIKATVWLNGANRNQKGMVVEGQVKYSLVNLEVEEATSNSGYGLYITTTGTVYNNQSFFLAAFLSGTKVQNDSSTSDDVVVG